MKAKSKTYFGMTNEQMNELRLLVEELDLVPIAFLPPETWPSVYEYLSAIARDEVKFDNPLLEDMREHYNSRLRKRKLQRDSDNSLQLVLFND